MRGFEVNYQQPPRFLLGFRSNTGMLLNYTRVKSRIKYLNGADMIVVIADLTDRSRNSVDAPLYYEDKLLRAQVSGAYRSRNLTTVPGTKVGRACRARTRPSTLTPRSRSR